MSKKSQQLCAFIFGVTFIVVMLTLAIIFPTPTTFQYTIFRIVLALATAGIAGMIPGFLSIVIARWIRATGALAVFVVVYFYNPAALVSAPALARNRIEGDQNQIINGNTGTISITTEKSVPAEKGK